MQDKSSVFSNFPERLKTLRFQLRLTQDQMGEKLNYTGDYVYMVESGKKPPTTKLLKKVEALESTVQHRVAYAMQPEQVVGMDSPDVRSATESLREIHQADPEAFKEVERVIHTYRKAVTRRPANLTAAERAAAASAPGALKLALSESPASRPSPKAGGSTAGKRAPKHGTGRRSKSPPESPTEAPK